MTYPVFVKEFIFNALMGIRNDKIERISDIQITASYIETILNGIGKELLQKLGRKDFFLLLDHHTNQAFRKYRETSGKQEFENWPEMN